MGLTPSEITLRRSTEENYLEKSGKNSKLRQTFVISSILVIFLFFINLTPFSYADLISTIPVGTFPYGITYGTAYGNGNVYVALLGGNSVSVISDMTNSVVATIPVGMNPNGIVYGNGNIYVTNYGGGTVSVISSVTNSVIATIPVGKSPLGVAYGIGNVYVANYDSSSVSIISSLTQSVVSTTSVGTNPSWVAFDSNNGYVYVSFIYGGSVSVLNGVVQPSITPTIISPPSISITSPSNGAIINSDSLTVSGTVSNSTAIKSMQITLDGVTSFQTSGTTWSVLITALTSGAHTIT